MDVEIKWNTGKCEIHLEHFFPAPKYKVNHLMKLIRLDYAHDTEIISTILSFLKNEVVQITELGKKNAKLYLDSKQKYSDLSRMVSSRKRPNGVRLTKSELQQIKQDVAAVKAEVAEYEKNLRFYKSNVEKLQRNIEQIELLEGR